MASVTTYVDQAIARIDIKAQVNNAIGSYISVTNSDITIFSSAQGGGASKIYMSRYGELVLSCSDNITIDSARGRATLGFSSAYITDGNGAKTTIYYVTYHM